MGLVNMRYAVRVRGRNGRFYWYFRRCGQTLGRLPGAPGSPEWTEAYRRLLGESSPASGLIPGEGPGTFGATVQTYMQSAAFRSLSPNSQDQYRRALERLRPRLGPVPLAAIRRKHLLHLQDELADKPAMANLFVGILSALFKWAVEREIIETSPTHGVKPLATGEHAFWPWQAIDDVLKTASPEVALAVRLAYRTGQRRGDIVKIRWDQIEGDALFVRQQKTGRELWIPLHPDLAEALASAPRRTLTILANPAGHPWSPNALTAAVTAAAVAAGHPGLTLHGLRKSAAIALAEAGCSAHEIQSITGHASLAMAEHYTKGASQRTLATAAIRRLRTNKNRT